MPAVVQVEVQGEFQHGRAVDIATAGKLLQTGKELVAAAECYHVQEVHVQMMPRSKCLCKPCWLYSE